MRGVKKLLCALFLLCALLRALPAARAAASPPAVTAHSYIVIDADTGQALLSQNGSGRNYPASITKIMTIALAMQKCGGDLSGQVTVSYAATHELEAGSSHVALQPGEVVTLEDLFNAAILASANDAANVLAEYTAGSMDAFADAMNEKAAALGMTGTHFVNASGLHDDAHYTTARDMAVLTRWALTVPGFAEIFGATQYEMQPTNKQTETRLWGTDNCMLVENKYQYEGTTGGKSGWTQEAGYTMVETVTRGDRSLICVVMGSAKKYDKFSDSIALLDYCFENFHTVTLDASAIQAPGVPLYYEESAPSLGAASVYPAAKSYTFWLHTSLTENDVCETFNLPEKYTIGDAFSGSMTFSLTPEAAARGCMAAQLGTFPLRIDDGSVETLLTANEKEFVDEPRIPKGPQAVVNALGTLAGVVVLLAALAGVRIAYVAAVRARRRKRRAAQRAAARGPYTQHADTQERLSRLRAGASVAEAPAAPAAPVTRARGAGYRPAHARTGKAPRNPAQRASRGRYVPAHARGKKKEEQP